MKASEKNKRADSQTILTFIIKTPDDRQFCAIITHDKNMKHPLSEERRGFTKFTYGASLIEPQNSGHIRYT